jgi:Asp-tRNA(Asn)/Glu-tRNA(Gln) amidotransferase A subunit family amidase
VLARGSEVVTDAVYRKAVDDYLPRLRAVLRETFTRTKTVALVFPATMTTAPRIGDEGALLIGGRKVSFEDAMSRNIAPGSTAGAPGLVIPAGFPRTACPLPSNSTVPRDRTGRCSVSALRPSRCWGQYRRRAFEKNTTSGGT